MFSFIIIFIGIIIVGISIILEPIMLIFAILFAALAGTWYGGLRRRYRMEKARRSLTRPIEDDNDGSHPDGAYANQDPDLPVYPHRK